MNVFGKNRLKIVVLFLNLISLNTFIQAAKEPHFFDKITQAFSDPLVFAKNNMQILHILRAIMHVPYIVTLDSQDPHVIKTAALLCALSTNAKCSYELFRDRERTSLAKLMVTDVLKIGGYIAFLYYDLARFLEASNIALQNGQKQSIEKARSIKINQYVFLLLEVILRAVSQISFNGEKEYDTKENLPARLIAEIADVVEMWRLITRYSVYCALSKVQANLRFVFQWQESTNIPYDADELEKDETGAQDLAKEPTEENNPLTS